MEYGILEWNTGKEYWNGILEYWNTRMALLVDFVVIVANTRGVGSLNVNKLISKQRFCSIFDWPYHCNFGLLFSK